MSDIGGREPLQHWEYVHAGRVLRAQFVEALDRQPWVLLDVCAGFGRDDDSYNQFFGTAASSRPLPFVAQRRISAA